MNRRSFFTKAALFVAGCQLALKCYNKVESLVWHGDMPDSYSGLTLEKLRDAVKILNEDDGKYYNMKVYPNGIQFIHVEELI